MAREFELFYKDNGVYENIGIRTLKEGALMFLTTLIDEKNINDLFVLDTINTNMHDESKIFYPLSTWKDRDN